MLLQNYTEVQHHVTAFKNRCKTLNSRKNYAKYLLRLIWLLEAYHLERFTLRQRFSQMKSDHEVTTPTCDVDLYYIGIKYVIAALDLERRHSSHD